MMGSSFLCSIFTQLAVGHWRQFVQPLLPTFVVVEIYVALNGRYQAVVILEVAKVVHFALENAPETFHRTVVDAAADTRHALYHSRFIQSDLELPTCILKTAVTMEQRVSVRVFGNGQIKGVECELVVVASPHGERNNASVFEVENCAQIQLFIISVLEFCDVGQPLFVSLFRRKITVQNVLRRNFRLERWYCGRFLRMTAFKPTSLERRYIRL